MDVAQLAFTSQDAMVYMGINWSPGIGLTLPRVGLGHGFPLHHLLGPSPPRVGSKVTCSVTPALTAWAAPPEPLPASHYPGTSQLHTCHALAQHSVSWEHLEAAGPVVLKTAPGTQQAPTEHMQNVGTERLSFRLHAGEGYSIFIIAREG